MTPNCKTIAAVATHCTASTHTRISQKVVRNSSINARQYSSIASSPRRSIPILFSSSSQSSLASTRNNNISGYRARRSFFSLPDISKLAGLTQTSEEQDIEKDGEQQRFNARSILPYTQTQLYSIVADVPSYSQFIPFCNSSTVLGNHSVSTSTSGSPQSQSSSGSKSMERWKVSEEPFDVDAELTVGFGGFEERYVSRVVGKPFESVTATAASDQTPLFRSLVTTWSFSPASTLSPHPSANSRPSTISEATRLPNDTSPEDPTSGPTLLSINVAFTFSNPLHRIASQAVLPMVADKMVEAFEKRCMEVYGPGKQ